MWVKVVRQRGVLIHEISPSDTLPLQCIFINGLSFSVTLMSYTWLTQMVFDPQPHPRMISCLAEKKVTRFACGANHTIAVCSDGGVWSWGFGGYGRLGHNVQQVSCTRKLNTWCAGLVALRSDPYTAVAIDQCILHQFNEVWNRQVWRANPASHC